MFGAADEWNGVGIFFDSFDNDGKVSWKQTLLAKFINEFSACFLHITLWKIMGCYFPTLPPFGLR